MHDFPWKDVQVDAQGGAIAQVCGCGCGYTRTRQKSPLDPAVTKVDGDAPEQKWSFANVAIKKGAIA